MIHHIQNRFVFLGTLAIAGLSLTAPAFGQLTKLCPVYTSDGYDLVGADIDAAGGKTIVGNPGHYQYDFHNGEAYVYRTYNGEARSYNTIYTPEAGHIHFGTAVAIEGNAAAVSAPFRSGGGAVFLYYNGSSGGYVKAMKLQPSSLSANADFGNRMALNDNILLVDARGDRQIYAYKLHPGVGYQFGAYLRDVFDYPADMAGLSDIDYANGRAFLAGSNDLGESAVYVMEMNPNYYTFSLDQTLTGYSNSEGFGASMEATEDGDYLVVGSPNYTNNDGEVGAAYVYRWNYNSYILDDLLTASDGMDGDRFGHAVSISDYGNLYLLVGAFFSNTTYHYKKVLSGYPQTYETKINGGSGTDSFGSNQLALQGSHSYIVDFNAECRSIGSAIDSAGAIYFKP